MLPRRYALLALLAAVACHESTAPGAPLGPAIHIESPVSGATLGDTIVQLRGLAEAPGAVDWVEVTYDYANQTGNSIILYRYDEHYKPDGTIDSPTRVPFDLPLRMNAGAKQVTVRMEYRINRDRPIGNPPPSMSVTVPFQIWKKPVLKLASELSDTVYARSLSLLVGSVGLDRTPSVEMLIDPGTLNERHVAAGERGPWAYLPPSTTDSFFRWIFDVTDPLPNGPHRVVLRLSDEMGAADSIVRTFITYVAPLTYTVSVLPGLGGTDSDALDVNAAGNVAGWALDVGGASRAVLWKNGAIMTLPTSSTALAGQAYSLNNVGDIAGMVDDTVGASHCPRAVRWTTATWQYVNVGRSLCYHVAARINASGETLVAGSSSWFGDTTAWLVRDSTVTYFKNVERWQPLWPLGMSLNDRGEVAGAQRSSYGTLGPFSSGPAIVSPTFRAPLTVGHPTGGIDGLNNASQVVGDWSGTLYFSPQPGAALIDLNPYLLPRSTRISLTENGSVMAFDPTEHAAYIWRSGRTYRVAIDADWVLDKVSDMNDAGVIVGHATQRSTGRTTAVILRP